MIRKVLPWGLLLIAPAAWFYLSRTRPVEQPLQVVLGDRRAALSSVEIECLGPAGEVITSRWSAPLPAELSLTWFASPGDATCQVELSTPSHRHSFERQLTLNGQLTLVRAEQEVGSITTRSGVSPTE